MTSRLEHRRQMQAGIFDAAIRLFDQRGYDDTSVEEICAEAEVGRATFFRYYDTKTGLIRELDRRVARKAAERLTDTGASTFAESLQAVADALCETWENASPGLRALGAESPTLPHQSRRVFAHVLDVVVGIVRTARRNGELRSDLPPTLIAYIVVVQLLGPIGFWIENPDFDLRTLVEGSLQHCLDGYLSGAHL